MPELLSHEELEELIIADALSGLDQPDREFLLEEFGRHGPDCEACNELVAEYSEVAGRLAMTIDPVPMSSEAEERLLRAALGEETVSPAPAAERRTPRAPGPGRRWLAAVAAAAALLVGAGAVGYFIAPRGSTVQTRFLSFVARPGARVAAFQARGGQQLAVAFRPGERQAWIVGANLPRPPGDKVYELWYQPSPNASMVPAGTFVPEGGKVLAPTSVGTSLVALAVTIEPPGGSERPTPPVIYQTAV